MPLSERTFAEPRPELVEMQTTAMRDIGRSADLFLATPSAHADGGRRRGAKIEIGEGGHRKKSVSGVRRVVQATFRTDRAVPRACSPSARSEMSKKKKRERRSVAGFIAELATAAHQPVSLGELISYREQAITI